MLIQICFPLIIILFSTTKAYLKVNVHNLRNHNFYQIQYQHNVLNQNLVRKMISSNINLQEARFNLINTFRYNINNIINNIKYIRNMNNKSNQKLIEYDQTINPYIYKTSFQTFEEVQLDKQKRPVFLARIISWLLRRIVVSNTEDVVGLEMKVIALSNKHIIRGKLDTIEMKFEKISYADFFVSGGGKLIIKDLNLRMRRFLFQNVQSVKKPYKIYCDLLLTQQDILKSKFIRGLIQLLVDTILERVLGANNIMNIAIKKVSINSRKVYASGVARILSDSNSKNKNNLQDGLVSIDFEVCTGAGIRDNGQTIFLKDIQVVLNPDSVLRTVMPITTSSPIEVDIGADSQIQSLVIANKNIWVRAASLVSTVQPFAVTENKSKATYYYDLSVLLTTILKLNGGILSSRIPWFNRNNL